MAKPSLLLLSGAAALLPGCAAQGDFPSLAPRPIERALSGTPLPPCARDGVDQGCATGETPAAAQPAPPADDPQLAARIAALLDEGRRGQSDFAAALPRTDEAVRRAGAAQSESWIAAQQEISALEAARAQTVDALAELDSLVLARSNDGATGAADLERLRLASEDLRGIAEAQQAELARLNGALSPP